MTFKAERKWISVSHGKGKTGLSRKQNGQYKRESRTVKFQFSSEMMKKDGRKAMKSIIDIGESTNNKLQY